MNHSRLWILAALCTGCTPPNYHRCDKPGRVSLTMRGTGWSQIGDELLHIRVFDTRDDWVEQSDSEPLPQDGNLEVLYECGLDEGVNYSVALYINTNGTGGCQRADDSWKHDLGDTSNDVLLEISPKDRFSSAVCEQF